MAQAWQEHDGLVDRGGTASDTLSVRYGFDELARLTSVTYPSDASNPSATPRVVGYDYGASGSIDNRLSRVAAITDDVEGDPWALYTYLGADRMIKTTRPGVTGGLNLTYGSAGT